MDDLTEILAGRKLSAAEKAILPDQAARLVVGVMEHPLLRDPARAAATPPLAAIDPNEDLL